MLTLRGTTAVVATFSLALAAPSLAPAIVKPKAKAIKTTQRITNLSSTAQGSVNVGTSDGKIAGRSVTGALRAVATSTGPATFTARGTLFYPAGTVRYTLHGTETSAPNGTLTINATGKFTGGTGSYTAAQGTFIASGTKPANSFETWTLTGRVAYR